MEQSLKQSKSQSARLSVMGTCAVLFVLGSAEAGFAQQAASPKPAAFAAVATPAATHAVPKPAIEEEETATPAKKGGEGIKVHGHWKIVVANPDGTVASATEFENSLVPLGNGDQVLTNLLSGFVAFGGMDIVVTGNNMCSKSCALVPGITLGTGPTGGNYANLTQVLECSRVGTCFPGLTNTGTPANLAANPPTSAFLTLQGSFTETASEQFNAVGTYFVGCTNSSVPTTYSASTCATLATAPGGSEVFNEYDSAFTSQSGLSVSAVPGQVVTVTVTISFS